MGEVSVLAIPFQARLKQCLFGISPLEVTFARRGFRGGKAFARQRLEKVGATFLRGYHAALLDDEPETLAQRLAEMESEFRGFAFEGAAMSLALRDLLMPWRRNRLQAFLQGPGSAHIYMVHVGAGWALARLRRRVEPPLARLDPLLRWLAIDGYGFHEGYFHWQRFIERQATPKRLSGYARRVFDQGLGRSLWFVDGADVKKIPQTLAAFPPTRHADLWSGVGLGCAYAGGSALATLIDLRQAAGPYQPQLAQGAAFAAKARQRAGNPAPHTELACEILCGLSASAAANITDVALNNLPFDGAVPAYEVWRQRIQAQFAKEDKQ
jgi:enediyne biosynthesis protein E3